MISVCPQSFASHWKLKNSKVTESEMTLLFVFGFCFLLFGF
jgi:hypothetical protein